MIVRRIARLFIAAPAASEALHAVRHPDTHLPAARQGAQLVEKVTGSQPWSDATLTTVVRVHGAATLGAAALLALGRAPRLAATTLAILTAPLLVTEIPQRATAPGASKTARFTDPAWTPSLRKLGAFGGILLAAADLEGRPSLTWRVGEAKERRAQARSDRAEARAKAKAKDQ